MKTVMKIFVVFVAVIMTSAIFPKYSYAQQGDLDFQYFYDQLSPYGQWTELPDYGYVWIPEVGSDFVPYVTNGHWVLSEDGWTWASYHSWGWIAFHYGRWDYDDYYGWFWVPDTEWGPAWVTWRRAGGYYGWAPMRSGYSIDATYGNDYDMPYNRWVFVRDRDIDRTDLSHYYVNKAMYPSIFKYSSIIRTTYMDNNRHSTYFYGPDRYEVQRITHRTLNPVVFQDKRNPGENVNINDGKYHIYRPKVTNNVNAIRRPVPNNVVGTRDIQPTPGRNAVIRQRPVSTLNNAVRQQPQQNYNHPNNQVRQQSQRNVNPPNNHVRQQPQRTSPPPNNNVRQQPQRNTSPPVMQQPQRNTHPPNNNVRQQPQRSANPPAHNFRQEPSNRNERK